MQLLFWKMLSFFLFVIKDHQKPFHSTRMVNYTDIFYWWYHADWTCLLVFSSYSEYLVKTNTWQRMENKSFQNSCVRKCWKITFKLNDDFAFSSLSNDWEGNTMLKGPPWNLEALFLHTKLDYLLIKLISWHFWLGPRTRECIAKVQAAIQRLYSLAD